MESLNQARRMLLRLRAIYLMAALAGGLLAVLNMSIAVVLAALAAAWWGPPGLPAAPLGKALLSTGAGIGVIFLVIAPLYRNLPTERFIRLFEGVLGGESQIRAACHLARRQEPLRYSPVLLEEVGRLAVASLRRLPPVLPHGRFFLPLQLGLFCLLAGGGLVWNMAAPEQIAGASAQLLAPSEPAEPGPLNSAPGAALEVPGEVRRSPACRTLTARALPPAYLRSRPVELAFGGRTQLLAGTTVELLCEGVQTPARLPAVELGEAGGKRRQPFSPTDRDEGWRVALALREKTLLTVVDGRGRPIPGATLDLGLLPDRAPECHLFQPAGSVELAPGDSLTVLVEAEDDTGLEEIVVRYRLVTIDDLPGTVEIARPDGKLRTVEQRSLPLTVFGAQPGDELEVWIEVADINRYSGPAVCSSPKRRINIASTRDRQRQLLLELAGVRDHSVDLLAGLLAGQHDGSAILAYARLVGMTAERMRAISLFKSEDVRRLLALAAATDEWEQPDIPPLPVPDMAVAVEQQAIALDGLVEKLRGEFLYLLAGQLQMEVARLREVVREGSGEAAGRRTARRGLMRVRALALEAMQVEGESAAARPALFSSSLPAEGERLELVADLALRLSQTDWEGSGLRSGLEELSLAVDRAVRVAEGAYAQSMTRISSSFQAARTEVERRLRQALEQNQAVRVELEGLISEVGEETRKHARSSRAIDGARAAARAAAALSRRSRSFRSASYLEVDRNQVVEFNEKVGKLGELVARLKIEPASALATELVGLTNSMEFSLRLSIRYSEDERVVKSCQRELDKVVEARKLAEQIESRLQLILPQRSKLKSLRSERLEALFDGVDKLQTTVAQLRARADALGQLFPMLFGSFAPALDRCGESLTQGRDRLSELQLEEALKLCLFVDDSLNRMLGTLEEAARTAGSSSMLAAGGAQPTMDLAGYQERASKEALARYLEVGVGLGEREEWRTLMERYFASLAH